MEDGGMSITMCNKEEENRLKQENARLLEENRMLLEKKERAEARAYCERHGHSWAWIPYYDVRGNSQYICKRCSMSRMSRPH